MGSEELEVTYRSDVGHRRTVKFQRMTWAAWFNDVLHGTGRSAPNSFTAFERDMAEARKTFASVSAAPPGDRIELLTKLADLRASGFSQKKSFSPRRLES